MKKSIVLFLSFIIVLAFTSCDKKIVQDVEQPISTDDALNSALEGPLEEDSPSAESVPPIQQDGSQIIHSVNCNDVYFDFNHKTNSAANNVQGLQMRFFESILKQCRQLKDEINLHKAIT